MRIPNDIQENQMKSPYCDDFISNLFWYEREYEDFPLHAKRLIIKLASLKNYTKIDIKIGDKQFYCANTNFIYFNKPHQGKGKICEPWKLPICDVLKLCKYLDSLSNLTFNESKFNYIKKYIIDNNQDFFKLKRK